MTTSFIKVFGNTPTIKVLDTLLQSQNIFYDWSIAEICENSKVSLVTVNKIIEHLTKLGVVKNTRKVGKAEMFTLDDSNIMVQKIIELDKAISKYFIEKELRSSSN